MAHSLVRLPSVRRRYYPRPCFWGRNDAMDSIGRTLLETALRAGMRPKAIRRGCARRQSLTYSLFRTMFSDCSKQHYSITRATYAVGPVCLHMDAAHHRSPNAANANCIIRHDGMLPWPFVGCRCWCCRTLTGDLFACSKHGHLVAALISGGKSERFATTRAEQRFQLLRADSR